MAERRVLPVRVDGSLSDSIETIGSQEDLKHRSDTVRVLLSWAVATVKPGWRPGDELPAYLANLGREDLLRRQAVRKRPGT